MDTEKVETLANRLIAKLSLEQRTTREQLLFVDNQVGRHIEQAYRQVQQDPSAKSEFELAVYLRVWSEIASRLLVL